MNAISVPTYYRISPRVVVTETDNYVDFIKKYGSTWIIAIVPKTLVYYMLERVDEIKARFIVLEPLYIDVEEFVTPVFDWKIYLSWLRGSDRIYFSCIDEDDITPFDVLDLSIEEFEKLANTYNAKKGVMELNSLPIAIPEHKHMCL